MRIVPEGLTGNVLFFRSIIGRWVDHAQELGLSGDELAVIESLAQAAWDAIAQQRAAQDTARTATAAMHMAIKALNEAGSRIIKKIKTKAAESGEAVYPLAFLPAPKQPGKLPPPGIPEDLRMRLISDGSLLLSWKCKNPRGVGGVMYRVQRAVGFSGEMVDLGVVGEKKFLDTTVPAGAGAVVYRITAMRSKAHGQANRFTVNLGVIGRSAAGLRAA